MAISHNGDICSSFSKTFWEEREIQKTYWKEHSADLSDEDMVLDSQAVDLDKEERTEILALLPRIEGKSVLEFGAGIGHFTGELAQKADQLIAVDFIGNVNNKNEKINGHYKNIKFMCADVTSSDLNFSNDSMDLIFSNSLLMYLSEQEVRDLAKRMLQWVKVGGHIFCLESCFLQPRDSKRECNPTQYREPRFYTKIFKECHMYDDDGNSFELSLVTCKCIGAAVRNEKNQNQICWIWQKVSFSSDNERGFERSSDKFQYKSTGIIRCERVFGRGFDSTGGIETTKEFVGMLDLKPGQKVLDVGCGIGGSDFYMAENFDVHVVAIDISIDAISFAIEDTVGRKCSVEFDVADCSKKEYPDNTFDVIYSRDTILHVQDKAALFKKFYKWLKPGGKVLITDYCRSPNALSSAFAEVIKKRGFYLYDIHTYGQMLKDAGFDGVIAEDRTDQFIKVFKRELEAVEKEKDEFIKDFSEEGYKEVLGAWNGQIRRSLSDEQKWGFFFANRNY